MNTRKALNNAVMRLLRPLVKILLRHGVSHAEFSDLAKLVYVDTAENDFDLEGRKQSIARICVLTGLHRKDVNGIRERLQQGEVQVEPLSRAARVVSGWLKDHEFKLGDQTQMEIPLEGDVSFTTLVKRYSGDMPVRAVLDELENSGTVARVNREMVRLVNKAYVPYQSDEKMLDILGVSVSDLLHTIDHNLQQSEPEQTRVQLAVDYNNISEADVEAFKAYSDKKVYELLEDFDCWLAQASGSEKDQPTKRIGLGLYYFENDDWE